LQLGEKQGFQNQPGHENFKLLLQAPSEDAAALLAKRFPLPVFVVCDQGSSQARFMLAVLDPGKSGGSSNPLFMPPVGSTDAKSQVLHTDDVPLHMFMDHLKKKKVVSFEG